MLQDLYTGSYGIPSVNAQTFAISGHDQTTYSRYSGEDTNHKVQSFFAEVDWFLRKDRRGIQVYTGKVAGSKHRAVFSTMVLDANPRSVAALLLDLPNCRQWASMCKEARIEQYLGPTRQIVYGLNDVPFPVRDRDSYSIVTWSYADTSGIIRMDSEALPKDAYSRRKGVIRVDRAHASWRIVPLGDSRVRVENYVHVDPNGAVPVWVTNMLMDDAPYKALRKMRKLLKTGKYDGVEVAFLSTPALPKLNGSEKTPNANGPDNHKSTNNSDANKASAAN